MLWLLEELVELFGLIIVKGEVVLEVVLMVLMQLAIRLIVKAI